MVSHLFFCVCACLVAFAIVAGNSEEHSSETSEKAKFKSVPTTVKTFENDSVLLPCYLENAGTTYHVRWIKDKQLIADSSDQDLIPPDRVRLYSNHSIQVVRLTPNDTGDYVCEVVRPEPWSVIRQVHAIEVLHPAEVVAIPEIGLLQVGEGEMVDMSCKATGVPQPIITWNYNGKPLELLIDKPRLTFNASTRHLSGIYECIATNGVRDPARASIQLDILHPPIVWAASPWVHTAVGLSARLECHVTASPVARIHWFHGQMPLRPSGRAVWHEKGDLHQLLIRNVKDADLGSYTCKAENRKGMAEAKIFLSGVANVAVFKMDPSKTVPTQTTFTLIWEVDSYSPIIEYNLWFRPYKPRPPQKEGVVMIKDKDNTWTKMTIPGDGSEGPVNTAFYVLGGLAPATAYEAQVISRNRYGWSKPSSIFHFFTRDYENKSGEKNYFTPPFEDGFFENVVLNTNASDFYATAESMEPEKIYSSSSPNSQNRAHNIIPFSLSFVSSLLVCLRFLL